MTTITNIAGLISQPVGHKAGDGKTAAQPGETRAGNKADSVQISDGAMLAESARGTNLALMQQLGSLLISHGERTPVNAPLLLTTEQLDSELGQKVEAAFAQYGVDLSEAVGVDYSAEATSDRIVAITTAMFGAYARQHPELGAADLLDGFAATLSAAVDKGYDEARDILDSMAMPDSVIALGQQTMELVHAKLNAFYEQMRAGDTNAAATEGDAVDDNVGGPSYSVRGSPVTDTTPLPTGRTFTA